MHKLYIITFLTVINAVAAYTGENREALLQKLIELKNNPPREVLGLSSQFDTNKKLKQRIANLEKTILVLDNELKKIENPDQAITLNFNAPETNKKVILEKKLANADEIFGKRKPADFVNFAEGAMIINATPERVESNKLTTVLIRFSPEQLKAISGKKIEVSADVKVENISSPQKHWYGGKLSTAAKNSNGKTIYKGAKIGSGSSDWKSVKFSHEVPYGTKSFYLNLGILKCTGTIYFKNLKVVIID